MKDETKNLTIEEAQEAATLIAAGKFEVKKSGLTKTDAFLEGLAKEKGAEYVAIIIRYLGCKAMVQMAKTQEEWEEARDDCALSLATLTMRHGFNPVDVHTDGDKLERMGIEEMEAEAVRKH